MGTFNIVIPILSFGKAGGVRVLSKLANSFEEKGNKVVVVTYYKSPEPYYPINCEIQYVNERGEIVDRRDCNGGKNVLKDFYVKIIRFLALCNALNRLASAFDIVIANSNLTAFIVYKTKIKNKFYYIQAYEAWNEGKMGGFRNFLAKKSYRLNLTKIVNAELYKNYKEIKSNYVVPPGLDLDLYYPKSENNYWDNSRRMIIGHIGRMEEWKGSRETAEAIGILQKEGVRLDYRVAFNAPKEGLCSYELVKPDGDNNLSEYYRSVDVLVAPARIQIGAVHYPVLEAMACGTPVITTGYYPATNNNAWLVSVNSPEKIAEVIKKIMSDYSSAKRKAKIAIEEIKKFSWELVSDKMLSIISDNYDINGNA